MPYSINRKCFQASSTVCLMTVAAVFGLCLGCTAPNVIAQEKNISSEGVPAPTVDESQPFVTTYIIKIKRIEKGSYQATAELLKKIKANGSVKRTSLWQNCTRCLDIRLIKEDETILEEQRLTDPLFEAIEYETKDGNFKWVEVNHEEIVIAIRTNVRSDVAMLQLRFSEDKTNKWITVKL